MVKKWTTKEPIRDGFYWARLPEEVTIVQILEQEMNFFPLRTVAKEETAGELVEWYGPIEPPKD